MKLKTQSSQKRKDISKFSNMSSSIDSISPECKASLLSAFPNYEKNILMTEQCSFQFQDTEYENGIFATTLHFIGLFKEQSKDQYNAAILFNILSLTNFILSQESQQDESLYLETSDFQINIYSGQILQISRVILRNYALSTLSLPKNQLITFYSYDSSLFPILQIPFSISQIFQFRYAALCAQHEKEYDHSIVQYFHSLMKSQDPIFNLKHIPNSFDRQQILPIFQSLTYIPTIFGISCRNIDTPSIITDISSLISKSAYIRSIKLLNCNSSSGLDIFSQAISSNDHLPLEELYLNDNEFEDLSPLINSFSFLKSKMTHLSLTDCGLDDSSLELLGNCLLNSQSLQNLKFLGIGGTEYKVSSVKNIIKYIQTNSNLVSLDLSGSKNFSSILKSIIGSSIKEINLSDCIFDDDSVIQLNYVCQSISSLNISGCDLNFYEVSDVISKVGKRQESLISIKLNGLNFSKERSFVILRGFLLTDLEKWKSIEMNDTQISSNELFAYQALFLKMTHLEHLSLNSNFKEEDSKNVASLFEIKSLKSINLANCQLSSSIIPSIVKSKVTKINLSNNGLNDQDALNLLSDPNLTSIKLNDNSFKNFDNIVQTANENPHLNEPPLKHGLSTIRRISPYSKDFASNISKFNIDHHAALNEDLKIPYPFTQKDHEEENLEIGNPSIYNLNKLNFVTIENNSSSSELKTVDMYPNVELSTNSNVNLKKKNKKENQSCNNSTDKSKQNNRYENNYNSEDQELSRNNDFNEYENQYDDDNQYDDYSQFNKENQYDDDSQYEKENQQDNDSQYDNESEIIQQPIKKKQKINDADDDNIQALLNSNAVELTSQKQINQQENATYDTSNSESVVQQNLHHNLPPQLEDELNTISDDNIYPKQLTNINNNNNKNTNEASEIDNSIVYSDNGESDEDANWFKNPKQNVANESHKRTDASHYPEEVVNSSSTMKSSASPSPKSQKSTKSSKSQKQQSKFNNQFDEDYSEEVDESYTNKISKNSVQEKKKQPNKEISKYDVDEYEEEDFINDIDKKRDNYMQNLRRALYSSENSDNEEGENKRETDNEKRSNSNPKFFDFQENDDDYDEIDVNLNQNINIKQPQNSKNNDIISQIEAEESENDNLDISEENQDLKQHLQDPLSKANKNRKSSSSVIDNEDDDDEQNEIDDENYYQNNKINKSKKNNQVENIRITPSKSQKVSKIPTPSSSIQRRFSNEKEAQNEINEANEDDEFAIDDDENNVSQKQPRKRRSRIPSPFELRQSSPSNKHRKSDIVTDNTTNFKSKIPGPRSPQRTTNTTIQLQPEKQQKQQQDDDDDEIETKQNQKIPRRVLFDDDETKSNENDEDNKLVDEDENTINNLSISSNEEPMVHKNSHSILDRHPSLSEEEEAFIRRMRLPRKMLHQSDESENYNDTDVFSVSSTSLSPQNSPPKAVNEAQSKKRKISDGKTKRSTYNENDNDNLIDFVEEKESFSIPKSPEPAPEESLSSAYEFVNLTSMLFSMPKKKSHNNQISPLILAFSPPFLED